MGCGMKDRKGVQGHEEPSSSCLIFSLEAWAGGDGLGQKSRGRAEGHGENSQDCVSHLEPGTRAGEGEQKAELRKAGKEDLQEVALTWIPKGKVDTSGA